MSFKQELTAAYHEMLDIKVSLGYKQRNYMSHILPFIEFCADSYPDAKEITKEMLDHWLLTKNFNADSTRRIAIINIRHFARFLNAIGKKAYIPPSEYNVKAQRYLPYIFTDEELVQLFDSIDEQNRPPRISPGTDSSGRIQIRTMLWYAARRAVQPQNRGY